MSTAGQPTRIGPFRVLEEIGRGATAVVYLAEGPGYAEPVAVKHIRLDRLASDQRASRRRLIKLLRAEVATARRLSHAHIIRVFDAVVDADEAYIVMEYFPGRGLDAHCSFQQLLPVHRTIGIVFKCCMALDHAYRQGIVHRDIKPANILIDDRDNVKITDFGLALDISRHREVESTFIMGVGSPAYMSPEQIKGYPLDHKTDLYSLGVVLFHLLSGRLPFRARNTAQLIYKIINADVPKVSQLVPNLPEQLDLILARAMEKDLYSRYRNGAEFAKDLASVRYQIVTEHDIALDTRQFDRLRRLPFFAAFEDVELWEILRISNWREVEAGTVLMREGDTDQRFGIVLAGEVRVTVAEREVMTLRVGDIFGESAFLDQRTHSHRLTITALQPLTYLELIPSALALASEECQETLRNELASLLVHRFAALARLPGGSEPESGR